ncbi:MAG TPA: enoyl-CoA hydratase/isomerase family protein [Thermoanaerobaculia bacterium]|nr:enoyl-CoA hydratase/isomerase family protein [Thermoanaerobaculia bacterium]
MTAPRVLPVERSGDVLVARMSRPDALNALDEPLVEALLKVLSDLPEEVGAVVLTGAGDRAFCAGADLRRMTELEGEPLDRFLDSTARLFRTLAELPVATIAAVNGHAHGAGAEIACACDLRVGAPEATFRFPGVRYGLPVGAWHLAGLVGLGKAKELLLTAELVAAEEALRIGLLQRLVPRERLVAEAVALGETIAAHPHDAVAAIKALLGDAFGGSAGERMEREHAVRRQAPLRGRARRLMGGALEGKRAKD